MIKVFIVDDEFLVRMGIKMMVEWNKKGIEICGEAADGAEALEKINNIKPDIVITDLKMPVMDGVTLIKELKRSKFRGKSIVLSNYNEFELVKEAIKNGASEYILKVTLNSDELVNLIITLYEDLTREEQEEYKDTRIKIELNENRSIIMEKFINDLINRNVSIHEIENKISIYGINILKKNFVIFSKVLHNRNAAQKYGTKDRDLFYFSVQNIVNEVINRRGKGEIFHLRGDEFLILLGMEDESNGETNTQILMDLCEEIRILIKRYMDIDMYFIYKKEAIDIKNMGKAAGQLEEKQELKFYFQDIFIIDGDMSVHMSDEIDACFWELIQELKEAIEIYNERVENILDRIFRHIEEKRYKISLIKQISGCTIILAEELAIKAGGDIYKVVENDFIDDFRNSPTFEHFKTSISVIYKKVLNYVGDIKKDAVREEVLKGIQYIKRNYTKKISLEDVSNYMNMNKYYFCKLFKDETGLSPLEYIIKYKMDKAKEILISGEMNVSEVANYLGYDEISYFNRLFKKHMGVSPGYYMK